MASAIASLAVLLAAVAPPVAADPASDKRAEARHIADQLSAQENRVSLLAEQLDGAKLKADDLKTQVDQAAKDVAAAEALAAGSKAHLAAVAVDTYVKGGMALGATAGSSSTSSSDALLRRQYAMTIQAQKSDAVDSARAEAQIVHEKQARLERARAQAQSALAAVEKAQKGAADAVRSLEQAQAKVTGDLADLVAQEEADRAQREADAAVAKLNARKAPTPAPGAAPGVRLLPKPLIVIGPIVRPGTKPPDAGQEAPAPNPGAAAAIAEARLQVGKPYLWGAAGPGSFDCSGLTMWAWRAGGRGLPHSSQAQYGVTAHVDPATAQPGDLFFYGSPIHHVGLYIGGGTVIESPHSGTTVRYAPAYRSDLVGVSRP